MYIYDVVERFVDADEKGFVSLISTRRLGDRHLVVVVSSSNYTRGFRDWALGVEAGLGERGEKCIFRYFTDGGLDPPEWVEGGAKKYSRD